MQRQRFFFNLGCLGGAGMLVLAALAFGPAAVFGVGLGIGIAGILASLWFVAAVMHHRSLIGAPEVRLLGQHINLWSLLGGALVSVAMWETVQSVVFDAAVSKWLTLANGLLAATLACTGLIAHEHTTERVIHVLEVIERPERRAD